MFLYVVGEEKELQHNEDDEELDEYDCPKHAPQRHAAEPVIVQMPYITHPHTARYFTFTLRIYNFFSQGINYFSIFLFPNRKFPFQDTRQLWLHLTGMVLHDHSLYQLRNLLLGGLGQQPAQVLKHPLERLLWRAIAHLATE